VPDSALPAGPFYYMTTAKPDAHQGSGHVYIIDAAGRKIASLCGPPDVKLAVAQMIIDARGQGVRIMLLERQVAALRRTLAQLAPGAAIPDAAEASCQQGEPCPDPDACPDPVGCGLTR
jgi:hypothetical protein